MPEHEVDWTALSDRGHAIVLAIELPLALADGGLKEKELAARLGIDRHKLARLRRELRAELEAQEQAEPPG